MGNGLRVEDVVGEDSAAEGGEQVGSVEEGHISHCVCITRTLVCYETTFAVIF